MSAGLDVTGGAAGATAVTEQIHGCGSALVEVAGGLAGAVPDLAAICSHPALALAAALDPFGAARVVGATAGVLTGESGLVASAAGCARLGAGAHVAAEVYRVAETDVERLASSAWKAMAPAVVGPLALGAVVAAPVVAGPAVVAVGLSASAWVLVRSAPVVAATAGDAVGAAADGHLDAATAAALWQRAAAGVGQRLADDVSVAAVAAQVAAARHPWVVREAIATVPVGVGAVVPEVLRDLAPGSVPEVAALLATAGAVTGTARQGEVVVRPVAPPRPTTPARDVAGLVGRLAPYAPPVGPDASGAAPPGPAAYTPGRIRLDRIDGAGGRRWVVYLPPTQTWSTDGGPLPADGTANLRMVGGLGSDALEAARAALVQAGVRAGEPVMAVGYSQGGMTAAALAADPALGGQVEAVLTLGSPVSHVPLPPSVTVLSLENSADLTPELDGAADPDLPWWTSVERAGPVDVLDPWSAHHLGAYAETARLVDASDHPSVVAWRDQVAPFLDPGAEATTQEVSTLRIRP